MIKLKAERIDLTCQYCNSPFTLLKSDMKGGRGKFCCKMCHDKAQVKKINLICHTCGNNFDRSPSSIKKSTNGLYFCSLKCWYDYYRESKPLTCGVCGKTILGVSKCHVNRGQGKFCSYECHAKYNSAQNSRVLKCDNCGIEFKRKNFHYNKVTHQFCSRKCHHEYLIGDKHHCWKGGISFGEYCEKFNTKFKERVRAFWGRNCGNCGINESELSKRLHVHHVYYNKDACCNDTSHRMFIPLCASCHSKTNIKDRDLWMEKFRDIINKNYNGKSYFSEEEYERYQNERGATGSRYYQVVK